MPDHDWLNCEICRRHVMRYGESYFDPETDWHPMPPGIQRLAIDPGPNLHRLKDGEVVPCLSLN